MKKKKIIHLIVTFIRFSGSFIIFAFVLSSRSLGKDTLKYIVLFIPLLSLAIFNICTTAIRICKLINQIILMLWEERYNNDKQQIK
ncbi:hypothetical protein QP113_02695 [Lactobacillus mulieris]|uniref:DUF2892 domain-containing protein n=1 Tax=Lactobacillus jensenii TaxID=109790 RepID=A0ABU9FFN3_LACJE|nr:MULTISPECIES: hypothetical protein [Lactobacillus]MCW8072810.1 hypothetical protein [Lactobacillus mulieris]MDK6268408.1 hypothetical protein [Lactobacillus mulieris]MDT9545015.1 hypothetical protein [Lactobacillus jensenii]